MDGGNEAETMPVLPDRSGRAPGRAPLRSGWRRAVGLCRRRGAVPA